MAYEGLPRRTSPGTAGSGGINREIRERGLYFRSFLQFFRLFSVWPETRVFSESAKIPHQEREMTCIFMEKRFTIVFMATFIQTAVRRISAATSQRPPHYATMQRFHHVTNPRLLSLT